MRRRIVVTLSNSTAVAKDGTGKTVADLAFDAGVWDGGTFPTTGVRFAVGVYYTPKCAAGRVDIDDVVLGY